MDLMFDGTQYYFVWDDDCRRSLLVRWHEQLWTNRSTNMDGCAGPHWAWGYFESLGDTRRSKIAERVLDHLASFEERLCVRQVLYRYMFDTLGHICFSLAERRKLIEFVCRHSHVLSNLSDVHQLHYICDQYPDDLKSKLVFYYRHVL